MSSQAQVLANRRNAQKSTGPCTLEGKAIASQNSIKHGLSAVNDIITTESPAEFNQYRDQMLEELDPLGPTESMLAERIVKLSWRLKRTEKIQNQVIDALNHDNNHSSPLARLTQSLLSKGRDIPTAEPAYDMALGRLAIKDFSDARVLERLLMYERRIEHSLFKTILEFQKLNLIRKFNT